MESLGVIPARGGSKRIKRKAMRDLGGKPLIAWTIEAARDSKLTRFVVSTEDVEIAAYCKREGVEVVPQPIDSALAGDMSAPVVLSALDFLRDTEGYDPDVVCLFHPTAPFRTASDIDLCLEWLASHPSLASVISFTCDDLNGATYMTHAKRFREHGTFFVGPILPYTMDARSGLDIDDWADLEHARELIA